MSASEDVTIVIPTYAREQVLTKTLNHLLALDPAAHSIILVDQTPKHVPDVHKKLVDWHTNRQIIWIKRSRPSQPAAMNEGLLTARTKYVLFHDDDIIPSSNLIAVYLSAMQEMQHVAPDCWCVVGQVLTHRHSSFDYRNW